MRDLNLAICIIWDIKPIDHGQALFCFYVCLSLLQKISLHKAYIYFLGDEDYIILCLDGPGEAILFNTVPWLENCMEVNNANCGLGMMGGLNMMEPWNQTTEALYRWIRQVSMRNTMKFSEKKGGLMEEIEDDTGDYDERKGYVVLPKISENLLVITWILTLSPNFHRHLRSSHLGLVYNDPSDFAIFGSTHWSLLALACLVPVAILLGPLQRRQNAPLWTGVSF